MILYFISFKNILIYKNLTHNVMFILPIIIYSSLDFAFITYE